MLAVHCTKYITNIVDHTGSTLYSVHTNIVDHAGSTLYSLSQMERVHSNLVSKIREIINSFGLHKKKHDYNFNP